MKGITLEWMAICWTSIQHFLTDKGKTQVIKYYVIQNNIIEAVFSVNDRRIPGGSAECREGALFLIDFSLDQSNEKSPNARWLCDRRALDRFQTREMSLNAWRLRDQFYGDLMTGNCSRFITFSVLVVLNQFMSVYDNKNDHSRLFHRSVLHIVLSPKSVTKQSYRMYESAYHGWTMTHCISIQIIYRFILKPIFVWEDLWFFGIALGGSLMHHNVVAPTRATYSRTCRKWTLSVQFSDNVTIIKSQADHRVDCVKVYRMYFWLMTDESIE